MNEHFGWIEIAFTAVVALSFGIYQLWSVNREIRRDREAREKKSTGEARHAVREHELDDR